MDDKTTTEKVNRLHFVGIAGSGMSALAQLVRAHGCAVSGSDRSFDTAPHLTDHMIKIFNKQDIRIFPQDGAGIDDSIDSVIVSSAIEDTNQEISAAKKLGIPIVKRAGLLSGIFNDKTGIAVGGTSGKSTVTAMIAFILIKNELNPSYIGGGVINSLDSADSLMPNAYAGASDLICVEADESDGSIVLFKPKISVLTNISKDHKDISELKTLFGQFIENTSGAVIINNDCPLINELSLPEKKYISYAVDNDAVLKAENISLYYNSSSFTAGGSIYELKIPGVHNISNALAAIAVCRHLGLDDRKIGTALMEFRGIKRRLELIGEFNGIKVYDDYSHNPVKIRAAITALKPHCGRILAVFQPHGFSPTSHLKEEYIDLFSDRLDKNDHLFLPEIYDAGGTASRDISSKDIVRAVKKRSPLINASYIPEREDIMRDLIKTAGPGDTILVMGARDHSLTKFCEDILSRIKRLNKTPLKI
ncbi:UDP-N-acetylmuramate--L-alanine ligase [Candidatus Auribacterota bacterium]